MNSASSCLAFDDCAFFKSLRRVRPLRPPVLNFRIFSLLRFIFSFFALVRHAASSEKKLLSAGTKVLGTKAKRVVKACDEQLKEIKRNHLEGKQWKSKYRQEVTRPPDRKWSTRKQLITGRQTEADVYLLQQWTIFDIPQQQTRRGLTLWEFELPWCGTYFTSDWGSRLFTLSSISVFSVCGKLIHQHSANESTY